MNSYIRYMNVLIIADYIMEIFNVPDMNIGVWVDNDNIQIRFTLTYVE
jgi:hypothetical protein